MSLPMNSTQSCTTPSVLGTTGRIGAWASTWAQMRGYDESLLPMGYEDSDLLVRCKGMGGSARQKRSPDCGETVFNDATSTKHDRGQPKS